MDNDKYPDSDVRFDQAPYFNFNDDKVKFDTNDVDNANENYGSTSGFVPKSLFVTKGTKCAFCVNEQLLLTESSHRASDQSRQPFPLSSRISWYQTSSCLS